jgi:S-methylmethionine-dependent homocysteine/selenocysteine methylase
MSANSKITILDGGMGHLLRRRGVEIKGEIGSMQRFLGVALANVDQPELVRDCHLDYLDAGADIISTNNYACVPSAIELSGDGRWSVVENAITKSGIIAREAVKVHSTKANPAGVYPASSARIAGCLPPLNESYRADRVAPDQELREGYAKIVAAIAPHSNLLMCETMSSIRESRFAVAAAATANLPVWVAWTLHEDASGNLRSGEGIADAVRAVCKTNSVQAVLFNCCSHESIVAAIPIAKQTLQEIGRGDIQIGAYANGFVTVHSASNFAFGSENKKQCPEYQDLSPEAYLSQVEEWIRLGCTIVGGCCGVFPEHIKKLSDELKPHRVQPEMVAAQLLTGVHAIPLSKL